MDAIRNTESLYRSRCDDGLVSYQPKFNVTVVQKSRALKYVNTIIIERTAQWPEKVQELMIQMLKSHAPVSNAKRSIFESSMFAEQIYNAACKCYSVMMQYFASFYRSFFNREFLIETISEMPYEFVNDIYKHLVANAADSIVERLGEFSAPDKLALEVKMKVKKNQFILAIRDEGIGLVQERVKALNSGDTRTDKAKKAWTLGGLGIGLQTARRDLLLCDGQLEIKSRGLNQGATAKFALLLTSVLSLSPLARFQLWEACQDVQSYEKLPTPYQNSLASLIMLPCDDDFRKVLLAQCFKRIKALPKERVLPFSGISL